MTPSTTRRPLVAVLLAVLLALAGCGGTSGASDTARSSGSAADGAFPVTVTGDNGKLTLDARPTSIVSMSATATEMLFAFGAGDQVSAVDSTSNYPADAPVNESLRRINDFKLSFGGRVTCEANYLSFALHAYRQAHDFYRRARGGN